jgi:transmembrane sensor
MEAPSNLTEILQKYLDNRLSPAEADTLLAYLKEHEEDPVVLGWLDKQFIGKNTIPKDTDLRRRLDMRLKNILDPEEAASLVFPVYKRKIFRVAVAAAIIIIFAGGWLLFFNKPQQPPQIAKAVSADVLPGKTGAVLTLENGQKIALDSSATGTIGSQGNVTIVNNGGTLAYTATNSNAQPAVYNTLSTSRGNQYHLVLPDGSKVWLNAASSITYPTTFTANREVQITGEAYFEVVHNGAHPFSVKAGSQLIEDIGTAFNVNAYPDESGVKTTLVEGAVKINHNTTLKPGQQAQVTNNGKINVVSNADVAEATAWKDGRFQFNEADIPAVMRQVSRWYNVDVVYEGSPKPHGFTGKIPRNVNVSEVLGILEYTGVHFKIEKAPKANVPGKIVVMP